MSIIAGIDEAGYGPLLGPLVSSVTVFSVPNTLVHKSLWAVLSGSLSAGISHSAGRLCVADSKKLFSQSKGPGRLERTALVFLHLLGRPTRELSELLESLGAGCFDQMHGYPWYAGQATGLPQAADPVELATCLNALRLDTQGHDIRFLDAGSEVLLVGRFNELVNKTRNKSLVLFSLAGKHIFKLVRAYAEQGLIIYADKQGGRDRYRALLQQYFPEWSLRIIEETRQSSGYEMSKGSISWQVHFQAKAESQHLPVALASIYAKYVRELFMGLLNSYWSGQVPGLRPTAGYYTDGRRFLTDIDKHCKRLGTPMDKLIKCR